MKKDLDNTTYSLYTLKGGEMLKGVYYFIDEKGNRPVKKFIFSLPTKERTKIRAYMAELKQQGHNLRRPMADYIGEGIYELRPKNNRIFYFFFLRDRAVMLHAIRKKTDKIPDADLKICIKRKMLTERNKHIEEI